jgi:hypothetical protein
VLDSTIRRMSAEHTEHGDDLGLLLKDFDYAQKAIDKFDAQRFQIKNWAITTAGGILAIAFGTRLPVVALSGVVTTVFFAFLEIVYTMMQAGVIARSNRLENLINASRTEQSARLPDYSFGISQAFAGVTGLSRIPRSIFTRGRLHFTSFYLGLLFVMIGAALGLALI